MFYSMNDMYPFTSSTVDTTAQTIAETEEKEFYSENTVNATPTGTTGAKIVVDKSMIWGALLLLAGVMIILHFLKG